MNSISPILLATESNGQGMPGWVMIVYFAVIIAAFYFLLIRPQRKKQKEEKKMRENLQVGDEIVTIGGICGRVVHIKEDKFVIETGADQVRIEFAKWAISTNETAEAAAKEKAKKAQEAKAKAKAAKKAEKDL